MSLSNWIELVAIVITFGSILAMRRYTKRKLNHIDGCGTVYKRKDSIGKSTINL